MKLLFPVLFQVICILSFSQENKELSLNLTVGDSYLFEVSETSDTEQFVMEEEQQIKQTDMYALQLDVVSVSPEGVSKIKATYIRFISFFERDNYIEGFDTDSTGLENNPEASYFKSLTGRSFHFEVDNKGYVKSFFGLKEVFKADEKIETDAKSIEMLQKKFGSESIQNILFAAKYPRTDSLQWNVADTLTSGILKVHKNSFSIFKEAPESHDIKYSADIFTNPDKSVKAGNVYISYELSGTSSGVIATDKLTGLQNTYRCKQYINGKAGMKYSPNSDHAYTWPITITNTITSKVTKIN